MDQIETHVPAEDLPILESDTESSELQRKILATLREHHSAGKVNVKTDILQKELGVDTGTFMDAINLLLSKKILDVLAQGSQVFYKIADSSKSKGDGKRDAMEELVYSIIESSGSKGIWVKEIRTKTNIGMQPLTKLLKSLENKKEIKQVRSVAASKRKHYMLYDITPDVSVTGGVFYSNDQEFDSEFVTHLGLFCQKFFNDRLVMADKNAPPAVRAKQSSASNQEVLDYIVSSGMSKVTLTITDIDPVLQALVYDGVIEKTGEEKDNTGQVVTWHRACGPYVKGTGLMRTPCGICPVFDECHEFGEITPAKCIYFTEWF